MQTAPIPPDEETRLAAVAALKFVDAKEERFDVITEEAVARFGVPISTITIIKKDEEFYKSAQGLVERNGPRDISFCGHALLSKNIFIVEDTLADERFKDNPMVIKKPYVRFYAGQTLRDRNTNQPVGVFCIKDTLPRKMSMKDISDFMQFAKRAEEEINKSA